MRTTHAQVAGADVVWHELRAMRTWADQYDGKYICGALDRRAHVVDIGLPAPRTLIKGEAFGWAAGFADARGDGDRVWALLREKPPMLLTMDEAAVRVPAAKGGQVLTEQGARRGVVWYPLHVPRAAVTAAGPGGRSRYVFEAQVQAEAARRAGGPKTAEKTAARWQALQELLPPLVKPSAAGRDITPAESPDPLPIPTGRPEATRRADGLRVGHRLGWFTFRHPVQSGFVVQLPSGVVRELPAELALPWVLGFADAVSPEASESELVAYRPGLG